MSDEIKDPTLRALRDLMREREADFVRRLEAAREVANAAARVLVEHEHAWDIHGSPCPICETLAEPLAAYREASK